MEEEVEQKDMRHHQNGRDSSSSSAEEESGTMSLSPSLPRSSPPRSQQIQQQNSHSHSSSNSRTTNFFIDNILRPDFGCRKEGCRALRVAAPFLPAAAEVRGIMAQGPPGTTIATSAGRENVNPLIANSSRPMVHGGSLCLDSNCSSDSTNSSSSSSSSSSSTSSSTSSSPSSKQGSAGKQGETVSGGHRYADSPSAAIIIGNNNHHHHGGSSSPQSAEKTKESQPNMLWPAWVYCTRYSDRPSSGPRTRKLKKKKGDKGSGGGGGGGGGQEDKRPRTAFTAEQLQRLKAEFTASRYITEQRRQSLATELGLNESQIKIWFQNKRAKIKKAAGYKNGLALQLMAQGLYNHSTTTVTEDGGVGGGGGGGEDSD